MKDVIKTTSNNRRNSNNNIRNSNNRQRTPQGTSKKKRRKKNLFLYYFLVLILMTIALVVLSLTVFFNISKITVTGTSLYSNEDISNAAGVKNGDNLFRLNTTKLEENVMKNLTNVESIKISRSLPSELKITITPCVPTANIENNAQYFVISKNGKIIEDKLATPKENLVIIKGFELTDSTLNTIITSKDNKKEEIIKEIFDALQDLKFDGITKIDVTDRLNIILSYNNKIDIEMGSTLDLAYKIKFVKVIIDDKNKTEPNFEGKIIMRGSSGVSVIPK